MVVDIVLKGDQRTGKKTRGTISEILTSSAWHPHGVKVRLADGKVGRVKEIIPADTPDDGKTAPGKSRGVRNYK
jgi:uncharacterized repeat protein (TIGR03833 family)